MRLPRFFSDYSRRQRLIAIFLGLGCALLVLLASSTEGLTARLFAAGDGNFYQQWLEQRNGRTGVALPRLPARILVVHIDDLSLDNDLAREILGGDPATPLTWPISRRAYPEILRRLKIAGARAIALDILFSDAGPDPEADRQLIEALKDPAVVLPYHFAEVQRGGGLERDLPYGAITRAWPEEQRERRLGFVYYPGAGFAAAPLVIEDAGAQGRRYYSLAVQLLANYFGKTPDQVLAGVDTETIEMDFDGVRARALAGRVNYLPLTSRNPVSGEPLMTLEGEVPAVEEPAPPSPPPARISDHSGPQPLTMDLLAAPDQDLGFQVVSLADLLLQDEEALPGMFFRAGIDPATGQPARDPRTGRPRVEPFMALVGVTATAGHDMKDTPLGLIPGVDVHATLLVNILLDNFFRPAPPAQKTLAVLLAGLGVGLLLAFLDLPWAVLGCLGLASGWHALASRAFMARGFQAESQGVLAPVTAVYSSMGLAFVAIQAYYVVAYLRRYMAEKAARENLAKTLREVCPIPHLEEVLTGQGIKLGGEERELTILFSDIRGYTDLSENLEPVVVKQRLNEYFGAMSEIFDRYGGIIFDYQGDAQMVVFGLLPASQPNHALAACRAAAAMVDKIDELREIWLKRGDPPLDTGIGVCTGLVSLGFMGSAQHKQYVAIGDTTNTASRVQGKSKELNAQVLLTHSTFQAAGPEIAAEELPPVTVKGKREPVRVYRLKVKETQELARKEQRVDLAP